MKKRVVKRKFKTTKLFIFLFIFLFVISIFMGFNAFAESNVFELVEAVISDKSDDVTGNITGVDDGDINSDITFHEVGGNVTYNIKLKNTFEDKIKILSISDNNDSDYLIYEYDKHENEEIDADGVLDFIVKITYQNEVTEISERDQTYNVDFLISYEKNGKVEEDTLIINPKTSDNITLSIVLFIISSGGLVICFIIDKKKNTKRIVYVLAIFLLVPFTVNAATITYNVSLKSNFQLYDKVIVTYEVNGEEFTYLNKYNSVLDLENPEVAGYRFDKWLNEDGSDFNTSSVLTENTKIVAKMTKLEATFDDGNRVHQKIKVLAGTDSSAYIDKNITAIKRSYVKPDISNFTYNNILSSNNSPVPIYGWFDNGTIYYWTEDLDPSFDANCTGMFNNLENVKIIELDTVDTSNVTSMVHMFSADKNLVNLDLSNFDTSNVTDMYSMFNGCNSLESLNISSFDTSNVNSMEYMFGNCSSLTDLDLSSFNTSNVTTMYRLLYECSSLKNLNISNFDMSNVTNAEDMIPNTITKIIAKNTKYNNKSKIIYFSKKNLLELDLSGADTSKVTNMGAMFSGCEKLTRLDVSSFDTSNVTGMRYMFSGCSGLTSLDLSNFNTSNVTDMSYMFSGSSNLTNLTINRFNTSNVENMSYMFYGCTAMTDLNLTNFNTSNVKDMSYMFAYCYGLTNLNVRSFNTINVENMQNMFSHNNFTSLNLSNFDTRNVTNMTEMFYGCTKLTSLDLSNFNTANVQKMKLMFRSCRSLTSLNISSFNTSKITDMTMMFQDCTSLKTLDLSSFDTSNVLDMSWMFQGDKNLISVNLSSFNTINTTDMSEMFRDCTSIVELDLSSFNTSSLTDIGWMINKNPNLKTIYVNPAIFTLNNVTSSGAIFDGCTSIVGGKGTTYRGTGLAYARVDDPDNGKPGYFTDIADKPVNP